MPLARLPSRSTAAVAWSPLQPPWTGWSMVHAYPASPASSDVRSPPSPHPLTPAPTPSNLTDSYPRSMCSINEERPAEAAQAKGKERKRRQLTRRCAGMGNAKYTSVPSRSLRSLPRFPPFCHPSLHPPPPSIGPCVSLHLSLFLSLPHRDIPTPAVPDPAARARGPRDKFALFAVPFSLAESTGEGGRCSPKTPLTLSLREHTRRARHVVLVTRACVALSSPSVCVYARGGG